MREAFKFGAATTADEVLEGIDLTGKLMLITGGSSGLGQETARALAAHGAHVVFTARNAAKGDDVAAARIGDVIVKEGDTVVGKVPALAADAVEQHT